MQSVSIIHFVNIWAWARCHSDVLPKAASELEQKIYIVCRTFFRENWNMRRTCNSMTDEE